MYCYACGTHVMHAYDVQPDMVTERRKMAVWKKEDKCMKFRLIALLALTLVYICQLSPYVNQSQGQQGNQAELHALVFFLPDCHFSSLSYHVWLHIICMHGRCFTSTAIHS